MRIRRFAPVGVACLVALVGTGCGSGSGGRTEVLGEVYERPEQSTTTSLSDPEPVVAGEPLSPAESTSMPAEDVAPPRSAPTAVASTPSSTTAPQPTVTQEFSDNAATLVVVGGLVESAVSSSTIEAGTANPFAFQVNLAITGDPLTFDIRLHNAGTTVDEFPAGLAVVVSISRDGHPWRVEHIADPAVTAIPPGGSWSRTVTIPADGDGSYDITASVELIHH